MCTIPNNSSSPSEEGEERSAAGECIPSPAGGRGSLGGYLPALGVVFAAAAVRLWQIDLTRFADDQATLLNSAAHFVATGQVPLTTGMSFTIGIRHPPLATLLLTPPLLVSHNPVLAAAYVAILDAFGALFVFWTGRGLAGSEVGLAAGLLYALEPAAVVFGRTIWNPDFVPLCAAIAIWGMVEFWQCNRAWAQALALFAIGCAAQLHPQAAALIVVWLAVALAKRRIGWPSLAALAALGLVLSPYAELEAASGWSDVRAAWHYLQAAKTFDGQAFLAIGALFSRRPYTELLAPRGTTPPLSIADPLLWFFAIGLAAGLAAVLARRCPAEVVVAGCFAAPLLAALDHSGDVAPHYLLVLIPSGCVLIGMSLSRRGGRGQGEGTHPLAAATSRVVLAAFLAIATFDYVQFQRAIPEAIGDNYGMPLRYSLAAANLAARGAPPLFASTPDEEAGVLPYLLQGQPMKRFDGRYTFVDPQGAATYVADASLPFAYGILSRAQPPRAGVGTPSGRAAYAEFAIPAGLPLIQGMQPLDVDVGHSLRLTGYDAAGLKAGTPSVVQLAWWITDAHGAIPSDLRQFAHLVDASGRTWSTNPDFRGYPRPYWQDGDRAVSAFALDLPADTPTGGYWLETGFYEPISGQRVPQYRAGQPAGTSARIGPLRVSGAQPRPPDHPPLATFGDGQLALLEVRRASGGVLLEWQALTKPAADYTVFVHVLGVGGIVAQNDSPPQQGSFPTSLWQPGDVVDDLHPVAWAANQDIDVGLYTYPDLRRVPLDGSGATDFICC